MNQFVSLRFRVPAEISFGSDEQRWAYARDAQRIRDSLPPGATVVAPRASLTTWRGRPLEAGAPVGADDFGNGDAGVLALNELVLRGHVLRSDKPSEAELNEIAEHVQKVRDLNSAFIESSVGGKLDALLAQQGEK